MRKRIAEVEQLPQTKLNNGLGLLDWFISR